MVWGKDIGTVSFSGVRTLVWIRYHTDLLFSKLLSRVNCWKKRGYCRASEQELQYICYLLIPWCRVLPEQLTVLQLVRKFPAFHGTRRFITALTSLRHLSLSWASPIQSTYPHPTSWRSILILSTHLRLGLPNGLFPSGLPTKTLYTYLTQ
jgi:hypothetical protein